MDAVGRFSGSLVQHKDMKLMKEAVNDSADGRGASWSWIAFIMDQ